MRLGKFLRQFQDSVLLIHLNGDFEMMRKFGHRKPAFEILAQIQRLLGQGFHVKSTAKAVR